MKIELLVNLYHMIRELNEQGYNVDWSASGDDNEITVKIDIRQPAKPEEKRLIDTLTVNPV